MRIDKILFFTIVCLLIGAQSVRLNAEEKTLTFGGKDGWPELSKMNGVVKGKGRFGYDCIQLDTNSRTLTDKTDLLIDFESERSVDVAGNYTVVENNIIRSDSSIMGKGAGVARGTGGLRLSGKMGSLFGTPGTPGSFLIEFWLRPSIAENGEIVFSWRSSRTIGNYPLYQMIGASFLNNHLEWKFTNVFNGYAEHGGEISLSSYRTIIPGVWAHHSLSYNAETGLLEYRIDGVLEALMYVTTNGHEQGGSLYSPILGVVADIDICPSFTGGIDDFHIQRTSASESFNSLRYDPYKKDGGRFETKPILISTGATLQHIDAIISEPPQTAVVMYVRSGDNYFNWTDSYPEWRPVKNHAQLEDVSGLYFQIAVDLYPDGSGENSPSVTQIDVSYTEVPLPLPPFTVRAESGDGQVKLTWSFSVDDTAAGYYVFYGERPGEYLGGEAVQGTSPLNVQNVNSCTITGLKNGKIYYFAVASYSKLDGRIMGPLSKEVYARPLKR